MLRRTYSNSIEARDRVAAVDTPQLLYMEAERAVISDMALNLNRLYLTALRETWGLSDEHYYIAQEIYAASLNKRPGLTAEKVSLATGVPRATVQRRLQVMHKAGLLQRDRYKRYCLSHNALHNPAGNISRGIQLILQAAEKLTKILQAQNGR